ncbi:MAG: hypothetical protein AB1346_04440 [Thermodesulfobacteriota bacterium]
MGRMKTAVRSAAFIAVLALLALPAAVWAADKGHEGMSGGHGDMKMGGHDMPKMGDKVFSGTIGPWKGEARIMDMKAHIESLGMKASGPMPNSHHIALDLSDAKTNSPVKEGKGTIVVTGPDKKETKAEFMAMQGHFGVDVNLPKPGKYSFKAEIESGGRKGTATFSYTLK